MELHKQMEMNELCLYYNLHEFQNIILRKEAKEKSTS